MVFGGPNPVLEMRPNKRKAKGVSKVYINVYPRMPVKGGVYPVPTQSSRGVSAAQHAQKKNVLNKKHINQLLQSDLLGVPK